MKKLILLAAYALVSFAAFAEPFVVWSDGQVVPYWPSAIYRADGSVETVRPTAEQCIAAGVARWETEAETAAREAAVAAANAEADAQTAAAASLPQVFPTGIAVLDDDGHHVELLPTGDGLPVIGAQVSHSPLTKEDRNQLKAAMKAAVAARKAEAAAAKTDKEKIAVLMEAVFGITK